jgi:hypothetical protein
MQSNKVLVLRTCAADMSAYGGFIWPESGPVEAPDWNPKPICGYGLHGALWGEGCGELLSWEPDAKWLVVEVDADTIVNLDGKVKYPRGVVVHCGTRESATAIIQAARPGAAVIGGTATAGYAGTATAGYAGTATAGNRGTATAGDAGTATAGNRGTATAGDAGTATAGNRGTATAGNRGTATAGDAGTATAGYAGTATAGYAGTATAGDAGTATAGNRGTATAGNRGTATAGDAGTATAGDAGTATAGNRGTATAGDAGTATAGDDGIIQVRWFDGNRYRLATGYVGEDGIEANVPYIVVDGKLTKKGSHS